MGWFEEGWFFYWCKEWKRSECSSWFLMQVLLPSFWLQTELEIEPRYPMFGGWRTSFFIGYGLPLQDFLFESGGKRFLNITFGCPMNEVVIDNLIVKVSSIIIFLCLISCSFATELPCTLLCSWIWIQIYIFFLRRDEIQKIILGSWFLV